MEGRKEGANGGEIDGAERGREKWERGGRAEGNESERDRKKRGRCLPPSFLRPLSFHSLAPVLATHSLRPASLPSTTLCFLVPSPSPLPLPPYLPPPVVHCTPPALTRGRAAPALVSKLYPPLRVREREGEGEREGGRERERERE